MIATPLSVVSQTPDICFFPSASKTECEYRKEQQQTRPSNAASRKNQKLTTVNSVLLAENTRLREMEIVFENEMQERKRMENQLAEFHAQLLSGELIDRVLEANSFEFRVGDCTEMKGYSGCWIDWEAAFEDDDARELQPREDIVNVDDVFHTHDSISKQFACGKRIS